MRSALLVLIVTARVAFAGDATGVIVTGDASLQSRLATHLETWLRSRGDDVVASPLPADALTSLADCFARDDDACAKNVVESQSRANVVVYARAEASVSSDGAQSISLTAHRFIKGGEATADRRFCEQCTDAMLASAAADLMSALAQSAHGSTGSLQLSSTPPGAKVVIGDAAIGITPLVHALAPGPHDVTIMLDRHQIESRAVVIRPGETTTIDVPLTPAQPTHRRRTLPAVLAIGGLATIGAGIALLAIDEDPSPSAPPEIRNTAPAGVAVTAVGGLALAAGLWMWIRSGSTDSAPVAAASRGGALVGWSTAF